MSDTPELFDERASGVWYGLHNVGLMKHIKIKRAYDDPAQDDGVRILVDHLWPRGLSKARAHIDLWLKDLAPSSTLRRWFNHDPSRWTEFRRRYAHELDAKDRAIAALRGAVRRGRVTLLSAGPDPEYNSATALRAYLARRRTV
jgi:uncharacterized protein YeaO (DUF488 family)